jgi:membrane fusion protein, multidrug efflux system
MGWLGNKSMRRMLLAVFILFALLWGWQQFKGTMIRSAMKEQGEAPTVVESMEVHTRLFQPTYHAVGTLETVLGGDLSLAVPGIVEKLHVEPGAIVQKDDLLLTLNTLQEEADWAVADSQRILAEQDYLRNKAQFAAGAISRALFEKAEAHWKSSVATVAVQKALWNKKILKAPFGGRIGLWSVEPGAYVQPGQMLTHLESFDKMRVRFHAPQNYYSSIKKGQSFRILSYKGQITALSPSLDNATRLFTIEGLLEETPPFQGLSGTSAEVILALGEPEMRMMIPKTAIQFSSYGNTIFLIKGSKGQETVTPVFIHIGERDGEWVIVEKGLSLGDKIVVRGQMKLYQGAKVSLS